MKYITDRLSEMSTWRGLVALVTAFGIKIAPEQQEAIIATGLAMIGLINVFRVERK